MTFLRGTAGCFLERDLHLTRDSFSISCFRGAMPLGMVTLLGLQGCSLCFASAPPTDPTYQKPPNCTSSAALPIVDGILAGYQTFRVIAAAEGPDQVQGAPFDRNTDIALGVGLGALAIGSAVYGANVNSECRAYQAGHRNAKSDELKSDSWAAGARLPAQGELRAENEPESASPSGGAGFEFGESLEAVKARCAEHQGAWSAEPSGAACSWVREQNIVRVQLDFCEGSVVDSQPQALCHIDMQTSPQTHDGRAWGKLFTSLRAQLQQRFGAAEQRRLRYPDECKAPDSFYQCLVDARVHGFQSWGWDDGHEVKLTLGISPSSHTPSVNVSFATAEYTPGAPIAPANPGAAPAPPGAVPPPLGAASSAPAAQPGVAGTTSTVPPAAPAPSGPVRKFPD